MMLFLTRFILASFFASLILLSTTVRSATLPQQSSKSNSIANRAAAQEGIQSGDQPTIILSATITSITPTSSSSAISNTQNSQETNENRHPDPQNGLLGPCVVSILSECMRPLLRSKRD